MACLLLCHVIPSSSKYHNSATIVGKVTRFQHSGLRRRNCLTFVKCLNDAHKDLFVTSPLHARLTALSKLSRPSKLPCHKRFFKQQAPIYLDSNLFVNCLQNQPFEKAIHNDLDHSFPLLGSSREWERACVRTCYPECIRMLAGIT